MQKRAKRQDLTAIMLSVVAVAGILAIGSMAPNVLKMLPRSPKKKRYLDSSAARTRARLIERGLLEVVDDEGVRSIKLTRRGERELERLSVLRPTVKARKWDGRWRIVAFDIPEHRKKVRDHIRLVLRRVGFKLLQGSMWVYPYDSEELVQLLKSDAALGKEVLYIVSEDVEGDARLRALFRLPPR